MDSYAYYNGKFGKKEVISISLSDRSIFFADAIYDAAIGSYDRILWEDEHIDRFLQNAKFLKINHSYTKTFLSSLLKEIAVKSMLNSYFIYFQISRCNNKRIHSAANSGSSLLITIDPIEISPSQPPMKLVLTEDLRHKYCNIKTTNLLPAVIASTDAESQGYDEAVFVKNGVITECAKSNISIIKQGRIITHPANQDILPGITRAHLLSICKDMNVAVDQRPFTVKELLSADEILVTGTSKLCRYANRVDNTPVGEKNPMLRDKICKIMYEEYQKSCHIST